MTSWIALALAAATATAGAAPLPRAQPETQDLKRLTLEQLMEIEVTTVTRQPEAVGVTAAAVTVITREDIRRSGVTTIADAIALADGMHVARFNNGSWAITARGFNGATPNKLLVMVDGRTEYSPLFTGVFWNVLDYVMDDIERIEVLRGPGATLWGANAVNGVVNIITRSARLTRGTLVSAASGNEDPAIVEVRHGAGSPSLSYRVYGKYAGRADQKFSTGGSSGDARRRAQAGLRLDGGRGRDDFMLKADFFHSRDDFPDRRDGEWTEIALQGRLIRRLSTNSSIQLQSYYRREYRNIERQLTHHLDTVDVDFQHTLSAGRRNDLIWGSAYRVNHDVTYGSAVIHFEPARRTYPVFSAFVQDEFAVRPRSVYVTTGLKVEHNSFSGEDWQPNLRARWLLPGNQVVWGALSRAVRRPTRFDDDIRVTAPGGPVLIQGNDGFRSEVMTGWETGYRSQPIPEISLAVTGFRQSYDRLRSQEAPAGGLIPLTVGNTLDGTSSGVEVSAAVQPLRAWRTSLGYTRLVTEITRDPDSRDVSGGVSEKNDPPYLVTFRSSVDVGRQIEIDGWLRRVAALPNPSVPAYTELNMRIGWQPRSNLQVALVGQDLLHARHPEFGTPIPRRVEFERSLRAQITWRNR